MKRFKFRRDLGSQLMLLYIIFVGLVIAATLFFARSTRERMESDIKTADLALARSIAQETDITMRNALKAVRALGSYEAVIQNDIEGMEELFSTMYSIRPDVSYIHRLNSQGFMLFHYPLETSDFLGDDFSYQDYFQRAQVTTQPLISKGSISPITNQPVASAVMPLWDNRANFIGVVATNIKLESLSQTMYKIADQYDPSENFRVLIIDSSGQIIAHPQPEKLLTHLPASQSKVVNSVLLGRAGNLVVKDEIGDEYLFSFVPVASAGWGVVVSRPTATAFATPQAFYRGVLLTVAFFLAVGIFFWFGLSRQAIRPLEKLATYSQSIGQKEKISADQRKILEALSKRADQVGYLTSSLIRMEKVIEARLRELTTLLQTSASVLSSLDPQTVLNRILNQVERLLNVEKGAIVALDEREGIFRIQASHGFSKAYVESLAINPDEAQSPTTRAIRSGMPVQVSDTETDPNFTNARDRARAEGYRSILAIPLNTQHAPPSALLVFRSEPHEFSEREVTLLSNFANHAAMAIENAVLYARSDTRLQEQTRRLEALIQSMNDGLILGNLDGQIIYANRIISEWTGLHPEDVIGKPLDFFIEKILENALDPDKAQKAIHSAVKSQGEQHAEISLNYQNKEYQLRFRVFSVTDSNGIPIGYGQIIQDITIDYELDRLKTSLISTVSHELRTPLASIKGYTTTLLAEDVEWDLSSQTEFLKVILDETDHLSSLVDDLLDLSRIEAGSITVSRSLCDFSDLIQRAADRASPQPGDRLKMNIAMNLPDVFVDQRRIEVVMRNLIENATKYADIESPISVTATLEDSNLVVKVEDEGPGIPSEDHERIFKSFYRASNELSHTTPGFGLGLSICQGFIKAHGGEIWTEPCTTGACIAFSIPIMLEPAGKKS